MRDSAGAVTPISTNRTPAVTGKTILEEGIAREDSARENDAGKSGVRQSDVREAAAREGPAGHDKADGEAPFSVCDTSDPVAEAGRSQRPRLKTLLNFSKLLKPAAGTDHSLAVALQNGEGQKLSRERRDMIERVIAFDTIQVADVMAPRADIIGVEQSISVPDLLIAFSEAGHSRLPVYNGDLDDPLGMVHIKDVVGILATASEKAEQKTGTPILTRLTRKVLYVPPSMPVTELLLRMQAQRIHMALVIDEFGGTDGLVTIEDLVEEIVGEINDEHDDQEGAAIITVSESKWDADARLPLDELEALTGIALAKEAEDEVDTLGGLVFRLAGRVPLRKEVICHPAGLEFEIVEADARRIRRVRIHASVKNTQAPMTADLPTLT